MSKPKFNWDGEKIKRVVPEEEKKFSPKEILDALNNVKMQINNMENQKVQLEQQQKQINLNLQSAKEFKKQLSEFEDKCKEIQKDKLIETIKKIHKECKEKAEQSSKATISKDPEAYSENQKKMMPYLDYQKNLATHPKVAEKISQHIIREWLYDKPVFKNPFN